MGGTGKWRYRGAGEEERGALDRSPETGHSWARRACRGILEPRASSHQHGSKSEGLEGRSVRSRGLGGEGPGTAGGQQGHRGEEGCVWRGKDWKEAGISWAFLPFLLCLTAKLSKSNAIISFCLPRPTNYPLWANCNSDYMGKGVVLTKFTTEQFSVGISSWSSLSRSCCWEVKTFVILILYIKLSPALDSFPRCSEMSRSHVLILFHFHQFFWALSRVDIFKCFIDPFFPLPSLFSPRTTSVFGCLLPRLLSGFLIFFFSIFHLCVFLLCFL